MTQSFSTHSKLDDGKGVEIALNVTGVSFRIGRIDLPTLAKETIIVNYDEAEQMVEAALKAIKERKNG